MHARMALVWLAANGGASSSISTGWAMIKPAWPVVDLGVGRWEGSSGTQPHNNHKQPHTSRQAHHAQAPFVATQQGHSSCLKRVASLLLLLLRCGRRALLQAGN